MSIFSNQFLLDNLFQIISASAGAFLIALLVTPFVGFLAKAIGAVDLPAALRSRTDRTSKTRIHKNVIPRLGGLAVLIAFVIGIQFTEVSTYLSLGVWIGLIIISVFAFLDDWLEIDSKLLLVGQILAAFAVIFGGDSIREITFLSYQIDFSLWSMEFATPQIGILGPYLYEFIFPADFITLFWIIFIINAVNWIGGVDGLNVSFSGVVAGTLLLIVLGKDNPDVALATVIGVYVGSLLGFLPYNYNPAKIFPGMGDFINGYMLAIFAILGGARWSATLIIFALPIIDACVVLLKRLKENEVARKNPLKLLSISDKNHLHHKLLDAGYSRKIVLLLYISVTLVFSFIALYLSGDIRNTFIAFAGGIIFIYVVFAVAAFLRQRNIRNKQLEAEQIRLQQEKKAEVRVITDGTTPKEEEDYERFIY